MNSNKITSAIEYLQECENFDESFSFSGPYVSTSLIADNILKFILNESIRLGKEDQNNMKKF